MNGFLPRFDQDYVKDLEEGSPEHAFVSATAAVDLSLRLHADTLASIDFHLRRPYMLGELKTPADQEDYARQFAARFEDLLALSDASQVVGAVNDLRTSVQSLHGREMMWADAPRRRSDEPAYDEGVIIGEEISFEQGVFTTPSTFIKIGEKAIRHSGMFYDLREMWNIRIFSADE